MRVPEVIDLLELEVSYLDRETNLHKVKARYSYDLSSLNPAIKLPATITLVASNDSKTAAILAITGKKQGRTVIERTAILTWLPQKILLLRIHLTKSCLTLLCPDPYVNTCIDGVCSPTEIDPTTLPEYSPEAAFQGFDAGASDTIRVPDTSRAPDKMRAPDRWKLDSTTMKKDAYYFVPDNY
jgi:hypothetical protein